MQVRRVLYEGDREVTLTVRGAYLEQASPSGVRSVEHDSPLAALVALHRSANTLSLRGMLEDGARACGAVVLPPAFAAVSIELPLSRPEVERRLGDALARFGAPALAHAVPLLLLGWPVAYRFAALFEVSPRDANAHRAVARAIARLDPGDIPSAGELFRIALVQRNTVALGPALALLPRVRSFDSWMDVLELADDVGDQRHLPALRALGHGRVPSDARQPLRELTREIARRSRGRPPRSAGR